MRERERKHDQDGYRRISQLRAAALHNPEVHLLSQCLCVVGERKGGKERGCVRRGGKCEVGVGVGGGVGCCVCVCVGVGVDGCRWLYVRVCGGGVSCRRLVAILVVTHPHPHPRSFVLFLFLCLFCKLQVQAWCFQFLKDTLDFFFSELKFPILGVDVLQYGRHAPDPLA